MPEEKWLDIPGFKGYQVSDQGRVRSLDRTDSAGRSRRGRIFKLPPKEANVYSLVKIGGRTRSVHLLVLLAFVGPRPDGCVTRHLNGVKSDNRLENLRYGTVRENYWDAVKHGVYPLGRIPSPRQRIKSHCPYGHPYTQENKTPGGHCRTCRNDQKRRKYHEDKQLASSL